MSTFGWMKSSLNREGVAVYKMFEKVNIRQLLVHCTVVMFCLLASLIIFRTLPPAITLYDCSQILHATAGTLALKGWKDESGGGT